MTYLIVCDETKAGPFADLADASRSLASMVRWAATDSDACQLDHVIVEVSENGETPNPAGLVNPKGWKFWGSDCRKCGNATADSMRCDICGSDQTTLALLEPDDG